MFFYSKQKNNEYTIRHNDFYIKHDIYTLTEHMDID